MVLHSALGRSDKTLLLPQPRTVTPAAGSVDLANPALKLIAISSPDLFFTAQKLQAAFSAIGIHWQIVVSSSPLPIDQIGAQLAIDPPAKPVTESITSDKNVYQEYSLVVDPAGQPPIKIAGKSAAAVWYGACTLRQLLGQSANPTDLPALRIEDQPDFIRRGVMLDISRDKVPSMDTLYDLIDRLADWKINEVQLYMEHTFAYRKHQTVWKNASPITGEEILALDRFCQERFIDLVPNQNSFGHMHRWLMHDEYRDLAEYPDGFDWQMFLTPRPFSLSAIDPRSLDLIKDLYAELLPHFSSVYFNIGCDETFDLGRGRSKSDVEARGIGRVYLDYLTKTAGLARDNGRIPMFWGDIIINHPDLIPELPKGLIAMEWGYEADHPFDKDGAQFAASQIPFYVCPGTSSWNSLVGRTDNAIGNLRNAADNGIKHGAIGYLNTDWGDLGHWQPLPVSYLGFAYGAALSWANEANRDLDLPAVLTRFAFTDPTGLMGQIAYDAGNLYTIPDGSPLHNGAAMVRALTVNMEKLRDPHWLSGENEKPIALIPAQLHAVIAAMDEQIDKLAESMPADPHVKNEYETSMRLWQHGCKRLLIAAGDTTYSNRQMAAELRELREQYEINWLSRNRPGGLSDSLTRLDRLFADYVQEAEPVQP